MRVKNASSYPIDELRLLLHFAARGTQSAGVEIHVKNRQRRISGCVFRGGIPPEARVGPRAEHLMILRLPKDPANMPRAAWGHTKRLHRLWPHRIPLDFWQDAVVLLAAHEFRHIWQLQRAVRTGRRGKLEYDAEKFAYLRLNAWRRHTGREPVPPVKQANPFARPGVSAGVLASRGMDNNCGSNDGGGDCGRGDDEAPVDGGRIMDGSAGIGASDGVC